MEPNTEGRESGWFGSGKYRYWVLFFIALGLFLRIHHYLGNRPLWLDEAQLALNFVLPPLWAIFQPLLYDQMAPVGFLLIEKTAVGYFGASEYVLRLAPLIAGILSIFLIWKLSYKLFGERIALTALAIFSLSHYAIYYSAEFKPYSLDIMMALVLYLATAYALEKWNTQRWLLLTVAGILGVWMSYPASFILAGIGLCTGIQFIQRRQWADVVRMGLSSTAWLGCFALGLYATATIGSTAPQAAGTLSNMRSIFWHRAFAPFPPTSMSDIRWYSSAFFDLFNTPLGFALQGLAAFLFLVGLLYLWKSSRLWLGLLVLPTLVTLAASAVHLYPFSTRLLVFVLPGAVIVIAAGIEAVWQLTRTGYRTAWFLAVALLMFQPVMSALSNASHRMPYDREDIRAVLDYVAKSKIPGDKVYIYYGSERTFKYYQTRYDVPVSDVIWGHSAREDWDNYVADAGKLKAFNRVWVVFSHMGDLSGIDDERFLLYFLNKTGTQLDSIKAPGASGYLYQFHPQQQSRAEGEPG
jgi:Dolichyl-phosphate-mannose-protein mannosyltransferase